MAVDRRGLFIIEKMCGALLFEWLAAGWWALRWAVVVCAGMVSVCHDFPSLTVCPAAVLVFLLMVCNDFSFLLLGLWSVS